MTETRPGSLKSSLSHSPTNFGAFSKCIARRNHDTNTYNEPTPTLFHKCIAEKNNVSKPANERHTNIALQQVGDSVNITSELPKSPIQAWTQSETCSSHTTRFIKHCSGRCAAGETHKLDGCECQSRIDKVSSDACSRSLCVSPTRQCSAGSSRQCISCTVQYKSLTYKSFSEDMIGNVTKCQKRLSKNRTPVDKCRNVSGKESPQDICRTSRQQVPADLCQKNVFLESWPFHQCSEKNMTPPSECTYKNISANNDGQLYETYCLKNESRVKKDIVSNNKTNIPVPNKALIQKGRVCNSKTNSPDIIEAKSVESPYSSASETPPVLFYNLSSELPSTSQFLPFFTPKDEPSYRDVQSAEFFTPKYSPSCFSPVQVDKTNSKDAKRMFHLSDIPSSLANIEVPLLDEEEISYCKKKNGSVIAIGQGVYGGVYLADLKGNPSKVVIKDFEASVSSERNIVKEAKILRHLQSTGFVPEFLGIARVAPEKQLALVQEYFGHGLTLGKLLNGNHVSSLSYRSWICILFQMATGMCHIHAKGVLHNDIQTGNILVDVDHPFHKTKFIDFGLATFRCGHKFGSNHDYLLQFDHLAPEVQNGQRTTLKSDVFSLGWVMGTIAQSTQIENDIIWDAIEEMTNEEPDDRPFSDVLCSVFKKPLVQELDKV